MFEDLFKHPKHITRHREGACAAERERFLRHCAEYGAARRTLTRFAWLLLTISQYVDVGPGRVVTLAELEVGSRRWARRRHGRHRRDRTAVRKAFVRVAKAWLRFLQCLEEVVGDKELFAEQLDEFAKYQRDERGLSPNTTKAQRRQLKDFFKNLTTQKASLAQITIHDVDSYFSLKGRQGCCRLTIRTKAETLRSFFRYAASRRWCASSIAPGIVAPRVFKCESLPSCPNWEDVQRLIADAGGSTPAAIRDRAILLLLSTYGLRSIEIRQLQLEDLDWAHEVITIRRSKQRRTARYPLVRAVGDAIVLYLRQVRAHCAHRELFLTLRAPFRPLCESGIYATVATRVRALNIEVQHKGPHCLRHACASRLLAEGCNLKEIGDHLGHKSVAATRVYAKVDLLGLREVGEFDLRGLS